MIISFLFFLSLLSEGSAASALKDPHSIVLSEEAAKKYFNSIDIIGKTLLIEVGGNFEPFKVTAVAKQAPENSSIKFNAVLPFKYLEETSPDNGWMWVSYPTYFMLKQAADTRAIAGKMKKIYEAQAHDEIDMNSKAGYDNKFVWSLLPFEQMHLNTEYKGSFESSDPLYYQILSGIAFFILLIATMNFINLTIASSLKRYKEIGVRKAVGGIRKQLAIQFLYESFVLTFLSFVLSLILALISLPVFNDLANKKISFAYHFDLSLIITVMLLFLLTGFLSGFYPALMLSRVNPVQALRGWGKSSKKNMLIKAFVVTQFSLAIFFIILVWIMYAQFDFLSKADLGYNDKNLIEFTIDKAILNKPLMELYKSEFQSIPGVESAGFCNVGKFGGKTMVDQKQVEAVYERVDDRYLNTIGAHLSGGRNFSKSFGFDSANSVLINETFVREARLDNPVGKTIGYMNIPGWNHKKVTVVGVVKDYHYESLKEKIKPMVFTMDSRLPLGKFVVRIHPRSVPQTLAMIEKKYQVLIPDHPFQYAFTDELNRAAYNKEDRWKHIISFAAGLAIFVSCIGLLAVSMLVTKKRTKEIAIRKVLGASSAGLIVLICTDFIKLVLTGFIIAAPLGFIIIKKWLEDFAYRTEISWTIFLGAGIVTVAIAMATTIFHAVKASLANPVFSLKQE